MGAQVPGCPSPLRGSGDGEEVFHSEPGDGAGWRGSGDEVDDARVETEGQGALAQCWEGDRGREGPRPRAQAGEMAGGTPLALAEVVQGILLADP